MKFWESMAAQCRYGDQAVVVFGSDSELIWEHSENDYQGSANILVHTPDGKYAHYEWTYGSCSGCDEWESANLSDEQVQKVMRESAAWFDDLQTLRRYLKLEDKEARYPSANTRMNGGIIGPLRVLSGSAGSEFREMGEAFEKWCAGMES